jgi:hypothetical protein
MPTAAASGVFVVDLDIVTHADGRVEDGRDTFMDKPAWTEPDGDRIADKTEHENPNRGIGLTAS